MKKVKSFRRKRSTLKVDVKFKIPTEDFEIYASLAAKNGVSVRKYIVDLLSKKIDPS